MEQVCVYKGLACWYVLRAG